MKKILLLAAAVFFTFSCSEYSDDGTPGDIIITNPDGTKKVKRIHSELIAQNTIAFPGMPADSAVTMSMNVINDIVYAADDYSFEATTTTTTGMSGFPGMPDMPETDLMNQEMTTVTTSTVENNLLTEVRETTQTTQGTTNSRISFSYNNNQLNSINYYEGNILTATSTIVYNADNAVITREYTNEEQPTETITINFADNRVTGGTMSSANSANPVNFEIIRDSINVSRINLSSNNQQSVINYSYDSSDNFKNNLPAEFNEMRLNAEIVSLTGLGFSSQDNGGSVDIFTAEAGLRALAELGVNNLTQVVHDGATLMNRTFTYDEDNYAVAYTETVQLDNVINLTDIFDAMRQTMIDQFVALGMSLEEATAQANEMIAGFGDTDFSSSAEDVGTIEYFE